MIPIDPKKDTGRSWNSVCRDCIHYIQGLCRKEGRSVQPQDCFAAVCRQFMQRGRAEEQNCKSGLLK